MFKITLPCVIAVSFIFGCGKDSSGTLLSQALIPTVPTIEVIAAPIPVVTDLALESLQGSSWTSQCYSFDKGASKKTWHRKVVIFSGDQELSQITQFRDASCTRAKGIARIHWVMSNLVLTTQALGWSKLEAKCISGCKADPKPVLLHLENGQILKEAAQKQDGSFYIQNPIVYERSTDVIGAIPVGGKI